LPRIELTRDQLTPPKLELEENAINNNSQHDSALKRLRDYLVLGLDEGAPSFYAKLARVVDRVTDCFKRPAPTDDQPFNVSIAEPDKLGTADVSVKDDAARWLMDRKKQSVKFLAESIRNDGLSDDDRRHAARTLELISGRRFHHEDKLAEADKLLSLHKQ
jgi:hypothetical protein